MRRRFHPFLAALCTLAAAGSALADPTFDAKGFKAERAFFSQLPFEHIDPLTGNLLLTFTDLVLPGNAGFDLRIQRTYNSKIYKNYDTTGETLAEDSWAGVGWTMHFGRVLNSLSPTAPPIIEMPDGSRHQTYTHISPPSGCSPCYITRQYWVYDKGDKRLMLPNGMVYTFNHSGGTSQDPADYATEIRDPFDNTISISFLSSPNDAIQTITQALGSQTRQITFNTVNGQISQMQFQGRTWSYSHSPAAGHAFYYLLDRVVSPVGLDWEYDYNTSSQPRNELTGITTPNGGQLTYQYEDKTFKIGTPYSVDTRVVRQRQTSGRDIPSGTWTYSYAQGSGQNETLIQLPCGTERYTFRGVGDFNTQGNPWEVGLQTQKVTSDGATLETETTTWQASVPISDDDEIIGFNTAFDIRVPLVNVQTRTRNSQSFSIDHSYNSSNFNDYGRPHQTVESGSLSRTINRTFDYNFTDYIVDKIASETVSGGGDTFTKSYSYNNANGFLTSQSIYGVTTSYNQTSGGNVSSETNARGFTTSYQYDWGIANSINTPQYSLTRNVNNDSTIQSETRRGFTTTFTYDALARPLTINPPIGSTTTIVYDNSGGTDERRTRGSSFVETDLDGFGRPSGTSDAVGVSTDIDYDACGRTTYESYPYTSSNIGTTMTYDGLGRLKRRVHPDGRDQTFSYNGIDVSITDERGVVTSQNWSAFGDPTAARLASVTDGNSQVTSYTYNVLGSLKSASGAGSRTWSYDSKNFLTMETHPESGQVTYIRDNVGNMTQRSDSRGTTDFTYDGNNRLTQINHPASAHDVTIGYDASDNRTSLSNSFISSTFVYDGGNRLTSRSDTIGSRNFSTGYSYDSNDRVIRIDYPSGRAVRYSHDSGGRITQVGDGSSMTAYASNFSYHPSGGIASFTSANGVTQTTTYDSRYRSDVVTVGSSGSLLSLDYGYDGAGNVTSIDDGRPNRDQGFGYDNLERLTSVTGWGARSYGYDNVGNRTSGGGTSFNYSSSTNRLTSTSGNLNQSFSYDNVGNMTADGIGTYTYTPDNMVETTTVAGVATTYRYDGDNSRVLKASAGAQRYYVHGVGGMLLSEFEEICSQFAVSRDYIYIGSRLIASLKYPSTSATVFLTSAASSVAEGSATTVNVRVTTSTGSPLACGVTVPYSTVAGNASAPSDFTAASGTLTFSSGSASGSEQAINLFTAGDAFDEPDETFSLTLGQPGGATLGTVAAHVVTILDDDAPSNVTVTISDSSITEGNTGNANTAFNVTLSGVVGQDVTINFATANGTATAGPDYVAASGMLTISAGQTTGQVLVSVLGDVVDEPNETFTVNFSNASGVVLTDTVAVGTILDDDGLPGYTDEPIVSGSTIVRAVHITELRAAIDVRRGLRGLGGYSWAESTLTVIRASHITEMRAALDQVYQAAGQSNRSYTDQNLTAGMTIKAEHINQLRQYVSSAP
jgi:YD repeat-containing protein